MNKQDYDLFTIWNLLSLYQKNIACECNADEKKVYLYNEEK